MDLMLAVLWALVYPAFAHRHIPREIFVADRIKTRSEGVRRNARDSPGIAMAQHTVVPSRNAVDAAAPGGSSMVDVQDSSQPPKRSQIVDRSEKYGANIGRKVGYVAGNAAYNAQRVAKDVQTNAGRAAYGAAYTAAHPLNVAAAGYGLAVGKMKGAMADLRDIRNKYEEKGYEKHRKRKAEGKWKYQSNYNGDPWEYGQDGPNTYQDESWQPQSLGSSVDPYPRPSAMSSPSAPAEFPQRSQSAPEFARQDSGLPLPQQMPQHKPSQLVTGWPQGAAVRPLVRPHPLLKNPVRTPHMMQPVTLPAANRYAMPPHMVGLQPGLRKL